MKLIERKGMLAAAALMGACGMTFALSGNFATADEAEDNVTYDFNVVYVTPDPKKAIDMNENNGQSGLDIINVMFYEESDPKNELYIKEGYQAVLTNEEGDVFEPESQSAFFGGLMLHMPEDLPSGKYTLDIPQGVMGNKKWANSEYTEGRANSAYTCTWDYTAKEPEAEIPEWVITEPLEIESLMLTIGEEKIDLLEEGVAIAEIPADATLSIVTNKNEYAGSLYLYLWDRTNDDCPWMLGTLITSETRIGAKDENGVFQFVKGGTTALFEGIDYELEIDAFLNYEVPEAQRVSFGSASVKITGTASQYEYSEKVTSIKVSPRPDTELKTVEDRFISFTFNAPVELVTEGAIRTQISTGPYTPSVPFASITSNEDKTEWIAEIPEDYIEEAQGVIVINLVANDEDGLRVRPAKYYDDYNNGVGQNAMQVYSYYCFLGCAEVVVVPEAGLVDKLYEFDFTCPTAYEQAIGFSGMGPKEAANGILYNADDEEVTRLDRDDYEEVTNGALTDETVLELKMHLNEEVTESGDYTLYLQPGLFMTGREYDSMTNRPMWISYTIKTDGVKTMASSNFAVSAFNGSLIVKGLDANAEVAIYNANGAKAFSGKGNVTANLEKGVYVVVANGKSVKVAL